jgi:hypothetical protein
MPKFTTGKEEREAEWKLFGWWWRDPSICRYDGENHSTRLIELLAEPLEWMGCWERIAWTYELVRRFLKENSWPNYIEVTKTAWWLQLILQDEFAHSGLEWLKCPLVQIWDISLKPAPPGWFELKNVKWNLNASDHALSTHFITQVHTARRMQKIPTPKKNAGRKIRGPSWRWPELFDLNPSDLSASDVSTLHKAKGRAELAVPFVMKAWEREKSRHQQEMLQHRLSGSPTGYIPNLGRRRARKRPS